MDADKEHRSVTFQAPPELVAKVDEAARAEMLTRAAWLRRATLRAIQERGAAA